jgi:hypothetical protein
MNVNWMHVAGYAVVFFAGAYLVTKTPSINLFGKVLG